MASPETRYNLVCTSKCLPEKSLAEVHKNLTTRFKLNTQDLEGFFEGQLEFKRMNIDAFTAKHYQRIFKAIGLTIQISKVE